MRSPCFISSVVYDLSPRQHGIPAQLWRICSRAFRTFSGHAHFFLWECTKWALLTYIRVTLGGSKAKERENATSKPATAASLGLASALNYGRCIIQDAAHTFSSSSRVKVRLNKGVIYDGPGGRNPVYGVFVCVSVCMRTRLLSGARFEYIVKPRCKCLFISLSASPRISLPSGARDSLAASRICDVIGEL